MPIRPTPTPPGQNSPSIICSIGGIPPIGVKLSCMQLTEPFEVPVVAAAQRAHVDGPKRSSLPSRLPPTSSVDVPWSTPTAVELGVAAALGDHREHAEDDQEAGHHGEQHAGLALATRSCTP